MVGLSQCWIQDDDEDDALGKVTLQMPKVLQPARLYSAKHSSSHSSPVGSDLFFFTGPCSNSLSACNMRCNRYLPCRMVEYLPSGGYPDVSEALRMPRGF